MQRDHQCVTYLAGSLHFSASGSRRCRRSQRPFMFCGFSLFCGTFISQIRHPAECDEEVESALTNYTSDIFFILLQPLDDCDSAAKRWERIYFIISHIIKVFAPRPPPPQSITLGNLQHLTHLKHKIIIRIMIQALRLLALAQMVWTVCSFKNHHFNKKNMDFWCNFYVWKVVYVPQWHHLQELGNIQRFGNKKR